MVAVLIGGVSSEREISLVTGRAILDGLPPDEFSTLPVEIGSDGLWAVGDEPPCVPEAAVGRLRAVGTDVVFPGLHGRGGEDGSVQGLLETAGLPYVGSGVTASAIAMDKARTRDVVKACGIAMPRALEIIGAEVEHAVLQVESAFGLPVVVKDPEGGSSIDVTLATNTRELRDALGSLLFRPAARVLIEEYIRGREFTCAVFGNASVSGPLTVLPPLYVKPITAEWFSFKTKYDSKAFEKVPPMEEDKTILAQVRDASLTVHRVLRCDGLTRTDFLVPVDGLPRFLEINTLPGLTPTSLCPAAAKLAGVSFPELLGLLVNMALELHEVSRSQTSEDAG